MGVGGWGFRLEGRRGLPMPLSLSCVIREGRLLKIHIGSHFKGKN